MAETVVAAPPPEDETVYFRWAPEVVGAELKKEDVAMYCVSS